MRGKIVLLVLALAAAAAVAYLALARGGNDDGRLAQPELTREAGRVCGELARANMQLDPPPRPYDVQAVPFFAAATANVQEAGERMRELRAPDDAGQERLDRLATLYGLVDDKLEQAEAAASVDQDPEVLALLGEIGELTKEMAELEHELGICPAGTSARVGIHQAVQRTTDENPLGEIGTLVPGED